MKRLTLILMVITMTIACSKTEPTSSSVATAADAKPVDYEKICERLNQLAPAERKESFKAECIPSYKAYLPACTNAEAVNQCFANLKSWAERLGCIDSCTGNPKVARPAVPPAASPANAAAPAVTVPHADPATPAAPAATK